MKNNNRKGGAAAALGPIRVTTIAGDGGSVGHRDGVGTQHAFAKGTICSPTAFTPSGKGAYRKSRVAGRLLMTYYCRSFLYKFHRNS